MARVWNPFSQIIKWYRKTPFGRHTSKVWVYPGDEKYQNDLNNEGFICPEHWEEDDLSQYPAIMQDLRDLDEYLLPVFWEFNQLSRHYQTNYFFYQWVFIIGAFLTTVMGVLSTLFTGTNIILFGKHYGEFVTFDLVFIQWQPGWTYVGLFSVMTTIVSAITSYFTILSNQGEPRKRWASYRRLAEELRMLYYKFLARMEPYNRENRVEMLRRRVIEIREQEQPSV